MFSSLKARLFVAMIILGVGPFLLGGALNYRFTVRSTIKQAEETLSGMAGPLARHIDSVLAEARNDIQAFSRLHVLREPADKRKTDRLLKELSEIYEAYSLMAIANAQGRIVSATNKDLVGVDVGQQQWFKEAKSITLSQWDIPQKSVWNSDAHLSNLSGGSPVVSFDSPIYDYQGRFIGVVHNEIKLAEETLSGMAGPLAHHIDSVLAEARNDIQAFSHLHVLREPADRRKIDRVLKELSEIYEVYSLMAIVSAQGRIVSATNKDLVGVDVSQQQWFKEAKSITLDQWNIPQKSVWNSDAHLPNLSGGTPVVSFDSPIYDHQGRFISVFHNETKLSEVAHIVQYARVGRTGYALLVRKDEAILASVEGIASSLDRKVEFPVTLAKSQRSGPGVSRETNSKGVEFFVGYAQLNGPNYLSGIGWSVLVVQEAEEVLAPTATLLKFYLAMALVGVALILIGGYFLLSRAISRPMSRLVAQTQAIGRGDAEGEIVISSKDEIGQFSEALSQMVKDRRAYRSAEKKLERQLLQTQKLASIGDMVAGVAHEVKNPLAAIKLAVQALKQEEDEQVKQRYLSSITKECDRLDAFLKVFFSFARPQEPELQVRDITKVIKEALTLLDKEISKRGITVREQYSPGLPMVEVDYQQIQQVFVNLFLNAAQAMPTGGQISIEGKVDTYQPTEGGTVQRVKVLVSDTGPGIPEEIRDKVFDPFFTTKPNGAGLGLAIVFRILEKHGGAISVSSHPGEGSTFVVTLPVKKA